MPIQNIKIGKFSFFTARCPWITLGYSYVNDSWFTYFALRFFYFEIGVEYDKSRIDKTKTRFLSRKDINWF